MSVFPPGAEPQPGSVHARYVADRLGEVGRWGTGGLVEAVRRHAHARPDAPAFVADGDRLTWRRFDDDSDAFAAVFLRAGLARGERVGVLLPDGVAVHVVYLAALKAGVVVVGIGPRAGRQEVRHLLETARATALVSLAEHRGEPVGSLVDGLSIRRHIRNICSGSTTCGN